MPLWAFAAAGGDVVDPGSGKRGTGWVALELPPHTTFNWLDQQQSDFIEYVETSVLSSTSLWKLGAFKDVSNMAILPPGSGLTGSLLPAAPFFSPTDHGSIYSANGQKTTWSGQDLLDAGEDTHLYPASRDTYVAYNDGLKTFEYNDVPNDDPAPTPTAGFINFHRVVTDATDITATNGTLPEQPIFDVEPTFARLGLGLADMDGQADGLIRAGDDAENGSSGVEQAIVIIGHFDSTRELQFFRNTDPPEKNGSIGMTDTFWLRLQTRSGAGVRETIRYRHFGSAAGTLTAPSDTDDFIIVTAMDALGHHTQIRGRITTSGGGGSDILATWAVPTFQVSSARVYYQEVVDTVGRVATESHFVFDGGLPPTIVQTGSGGSVQSGGLGANDLGFTASGSSVNLVVVNTGANARRYDFVVDLFQSVAP